MRWIFRILGVAVLLAVLAVGALFVIPTDRIAALVAERFEAATGRQLTIAGDIRPTIWPTLGISTGAVTLANADWSEGGPMLQAEGLSVGVETAALWGGDIRVKRVEANAPIIRLERNEEGQGNWELFGAGGDSSGGAPAAGDTSISLEEAVLTDGTLSYADATTGTALTLTKITGTASLASFDGPATLDLSALMNGQRVEIAGEVGALATFLTSGATLAKASGAVGGSSFSFDGDAGLTPFAAGGSTRIDLSDADAVFGLLGIPAPSLPRGFGRETMTLEADLTYTETGLTLRNAAIRLDDNSFAGDIDAVLTGARPRITARLRAGVLDVSSLADGETSGGGGAAASGWSTERIDASALQSLDADISLNASGIDLGLLTLGETRTRTTLDAGRAVTEIAGMRAYDGTIAGTLVVNSRGGLSTRANLSATSVAIQPLMQELAGYERLIATGDVRMNVLAIGNSMDALMRSLDGDVAMSFGKGELLGLDLVGMLTNLDPSYVGEGQRTIFEGLSGSFALTQGVAVNDDLRMDAQLLTATGRGSIDIGGQSVNYRLRPALLEGQTNGGLAVPLLIAGPWAAPKFQLDLQALAEEELADEIEAVKAEGERIILDKIEQETGVSAESLGQVEDAVKNKVEEAIENEVGNALRGLLGGN